MDLSVLRRAVPLVYGLAVVLCAIFAQGALAAVAIVGALLVGAFYALTGRATAAHAGGRQRARHRAR